MVVKLVGSNSNLGAHLKIEHFILTGLIFPNYNLHFTISISIWKTNFKF